MLKGTNQSLYEFSDHHLSALAAAAAAEDEAAMIYGSDEFRMYAYKIKRCPRMRSHDWTECPYAHRGEKAQRRDPRRHAYAAVVCPAFRSGASCARGDACEFAHGVFEYWLHPSRYRTRACNSGRLCQRKVCFFAHSPDQLRPETKPPKRHHHHHPHHYAYRPRAAAAAADAAAPATSPSPTSSLSSPSSSSSGLMKSVAKTLHDHDRDDHRDYDCFDKFSDFLNSLRALKISGGESEDDGGDDNYHGGDLDLPHVEWISELVK